MTLLASPLPTSRISQPTASPHSTPKKSLHKLELGIFQAVHQGLLHSPVPLTPTHDDFNHTNEEDEFLTPNDSPLHEYPLANEGETDFQASKVLFPSSEKFSLFSRGFFSLRSLVLFSIYFTFVFSLGCVIVGAIFMSASIGIGSAIIEENQVRPLSEIAVDTSLFSSYSVKGEEPLYIFDQKPRYLADLHHLSNDQTSSTRLWLNVGSVVHSTDGGSYRIASRGEHVILKNVDRVEAALFDFDSAEVIDCSMSGCILPSEQVWIGSNNHAGYIQIQGHIPVAYRAVIGTCIFVACAALAALVFAFVWRRCRAFNGSKQSVAQSQNELESVVLQV
mmetsp:Transcript_8064/g.29944  ORF Transcript_8064/g.29944 Transcript_8064/m.29944 type:complete len:335 (-) Transcript_8064:3945-4949(-)